MPGIRVHVTGIVQGVGFRPFVWRLATSLGLSGWVNNASDGVHAEAYGPRGALDAFVLGLSTKSPVAARVSGVQVERLDGGAPAGEGFSIVESSEAERAATLVSPDIATCPDCLAELHDPRDRRYRYPFINCTACGPRFTVIASLPYDRPATSMAPFEMCADCAREYADPSDRRFHAQPDACFECGPHISWRTAAEPATLLRGLDRSSSDDILERAARMIADGGIVAVKGLGGFHLACDATNEQAVERLRARKARPTKPLAVMFPSFEDLRACLCVDGAERSVLTGSVRPICLVDRRPDEDVPERLRLARGIAGSLPQIGAMLPHTPLQHLLLEACARPLVMTSGNLSDEPVVTDDQVAVARLMGVADAWIGNDRRILARYDDSVVRVWAGKALPVRRARGIAPAPVGIPLPPAARRAEAAIPVVLACGPEQKATFCMARSNEAFVSQHIGDLENAEAFDAWREGLDRYGSLFGIGWEVLACDLHPEYLASKWAREQARATGLPLVEVQHHHAHIAAVMAENGIWDHVVGIALDGTGYGPDGTIWGGEVLVCDQTGYARAAHLAPWRLPGGAAAVKKPLRSALSLLDACSLASTEAAGDIERRLGFEAPVVRQMLARNLNCPVTSSAGRLFDAVAALLGIVDVAGYDGEPACLLEARALRADRGAALPEEYVVRMRPAVPGENGDPSDESLVLDATGLVDALVRDLAKGDPVDELALRFHLGFAEGVSRAAEDIARSAGISTVVLGGGVFMNRIVLDHIHETLASHGLSVLVAHDLPVNDGGISYGQAAVARARIAAGLVCDIDRHTVPPNGGVNESGVEQPCV